MHVEFIKQQTNTIKTQQLSTRHRRSRYCKSSAAMPQYKFGYKMSLLGDNEEQPRSADNDEMETEEKPKGFSVYIHIFII
jgi:asparagine synthetase A